MLKKCELYKYILYSLDAIYIKVRQLNYKINVIKHHTQKLIALLKELKRLVSYKMVKDQFCTRL